MYRVLVGKKKAKKGQYLGFAISRSCIEASICWVLRGPYPGRGRPSLLQLGAQIHRALCCWRTFQYHRHTIFLRIPQTLTLIPPDPAPLPDMSPDGCDAQLLQAGRVIVRQAGYGDADAVGALGRPRVLVEGQWCAAVFARFTLDPRPRTDRSWDEPRCPGPARELSGDDGVCGSE